MSLTLLPRHSEKIRFPKRQVAKKERTFFVTRNSMTCTEFDTFSHPPYADRPGQARAILYMLSVLSPLAPPSLHHALAAVSADQ
jgi:hypothetical protein